MVEKKVYWDATPLKDVDVQMRGVIHVGAHYGQEYDDYIAAGIKNIVFIEPLKDNYEKLLSLHGNKDGVLILNTAIGNMKGTVEMNVETANMGMSSSILEPGTHLLSYPQITFDSKETVPITTLDSLPLVRSLYNVLVVDVQGYELEVFKGAENTPNGIDVIFTEVNTEDVYKECTKLPDLDEFLGARGFVKHYIYIYKGLGYGDAIYLRSERVHERGYWLTKGKSNPHVCDNGLVGAMAKMFDAKTAIDVGCGDGAYVRALTEAGIACVGYDGNPHTPEISGGLCKVMDFSRPVDVGRYDLVLSMEVGEHIPPEYEKIFIDNLCRASSAFICLSWAVVGQGGVGHVNCRDNYYIIGEMNSRGFLLDRVATENLRTASTIPWFKNTVMVFYKKEAV